MTIRPRATYEALNPLRHIDGETALHICNAIEHRDADFYCFDPFEKGGFEEIGDQDQCFKPGGATTGCEPAS